jgi:CDP-diacylglycerol---serine O-phosphatidyltransferase
MEGPRAGRFKRKLREPGKKQSRIRERLGAYRSSRQGQVRRRIPREAVPSFFTLMNLFSGFIALTQVLAGRFDYACWLIVLAGFFDVLDGMMARLTNSHSLFGTELDSLADVVSFGVAPAYTVYAFGLREFGPLGLIVASLPAICGAVRLARFNVQFEGTKKDYFVGLPIPGQAIILVALILNFNNAEWFNRLSTSNLSVLIPIVFVLSFLMVSNVPFDAVPKPTPGYIKAKPRKSAAYFIGMLLIIFLQQIGLLIVFSIYLLFNIVRAIFRVTRSILNAEPEQVEGLPERDGM